MAAFVLIHWALFFVAYFLVQGQTGVPQFVISALEVLLIPFILSNVALQYMALAAGSALERAVLIIAPTVFYIIIGLVVALVIGRMRKGRVRRVTED